MLQKMRQIDDTIIYMLNTTIPTESFKGQIDAKAKCKELFQQIQSGHLQREEAINQCLVAAKERINDLKNQKDSSVDNPRVIKHLKQEQNTLRLLQSELNVEEVVKQRSNQVYYEKCRGYYKPMRNS